jgi:ATP-dependent protease ClpP protease subunit
MRGMITKESTDYVQERLLLLQSFSSDPINLLIDSGGGAIIYALRVSDFISHVLTAPVRGIVIGDCLSAATLVLLHCSERLCTPNATFLMHSGTQLADVAMRVDQTTHKNLRFMYRDFMATTEMMMRVYITKMKLPRKRVEKLIERGDREVDHHITPEEAVKIHLVQRIVYDKLDIFEPHGVVIGS